jgi:hypothetical protein
MVYVVEQRIHALAENAVAASAENSFEILGVKFRHWNFSATEGWTGDAWLATSSIEAANFREAFLKFQMRLRETIPRISFIGQCYIETRTQPYLIRRLDSDIAYFRFSRDRAPVGLMFMEGEFEALQILLADKSIPVEFFYYWNDAVNTIGYAAKLLIMFSAFEALVKTQSGAKDWLKIEMILGRDLMEEFYGTKTKSRSGLRNRLTHGEYFNDQDAVAVSQVDRFHEKLVNYFNDQIFGKKLLQESVLQPQRHFVGNKEELPVWIRKRPEVPNEFSSLIGVLKDFNPDGPNWRANYEFLNSNEVPTDY